MKLSLMNDKINATNLNYLNLCGRVILRPLFVTVDGGAGSGSLPTSPPLAPDAQQPSCPIACFFWSLFERGFEAFLFKF
jgi:hypothetical protein